MNEGGQPLSAPYRSEVERALDELISHEDGNRFQSLAIILAKKRWPDLVASERKWDLGLDAYVPSFAAADGNPIGVACSLTASFTKLQADVKRILASDHKIGTLVFYTAHKVTNHTAKKWHLKIRAEHGIELLVISREDIVASLMDPQNSALCKTLLGVHFDLEPSAQDLLSVARAASLAVVEAWLQHPRWRGLPLIDLDLVDERDNSPMDLPAIQEELSQGKRFILEGHAGAGKTTTLLQIARKGGGATSLRLLIDLPSWIDSGMELLEYVSGVQQFRARGIKANALAALESDIHLDLLLNGWNEIPTTALESASRALVDLERRYPAAGIIVSTRRHRLKAPLTSARVIGVRWLRAEQRSQYVRAVAPAADDLLRLIGQRPTLEQLTRIPLLLTAVVRLFAEGREIPEAKLDILNALVASAEESPEHVAALAGPPILGFARHFLARLAYEMTRTGGVDLVDRECRRIVTAEVRQLNEGGQIANSPEPTAVLDALCAHHLLETAEATRSSLRFQHQQFQEFHAAVWLLDTLANAYNEGGLDAVGRATQGFLNEPVWEEPLSMIVAAVGQDSPLVGGLISSVELGQALIQTAIAIDPIFASTLGRVAGGDVWSTVAGDLGSCLRSWYAINDPDHKRCALAGMLASGMPDFRDVVIPLLASERRDDFMLTYDAFDDFYVSSLGRDWRGVVAAWGPKQRMEFLHHAVYQGGKREVASDFAVNDPAPEVRAEAVRGLEWLYAYDDIEAISGAFDQQLLLLLAEQQLSWPGMPEALGRRMIEVTREKLDNLEGVAGRIHVLLRLHQLGDEQALRDLRATFDSLEQPMVRELPDDLVESVIDSVKSWDPRWTDQWLIRQIASGVLWPERWIDRVSTVDAQYCETLIDELAGGGGNHQNAGAIAALVEKAADARVVAYLCHKLYELHQETSEGESRTSEKSDAGRQLMDAAKALSAEMLVSGILDSLSSPPTLAQAIVVLGLLGTTGDGEPQLREGLAPQISEGLLEVTQDLIPVVLAQDDFGGGLKAELATLIGSTGMPDGADIIRELITADIDRVREGVAARARGERGGIANGAAMSWSNWYTRALTWLGVDQAEPVLLGLISEPAYEVSAAAALTQLALGERVTLGGAWALGRRSEDSRKAFLQPDRRLRYAGVVGDHILSLLKELDAVRDRDMLIYRAKNLGGVLAVLDGGNSMHLVLQTMALPHEYDAWSRAEALNNLLSWQTHVPVDETLRVIDPAIDSLLKRGIHGHSERSAVERLLCILPFVDDPGRGLQRAREIILTARFSAGELRGFIRALGASQTNDALDLLCELGSRKSFNLQAGHEWLDAVSEIDTSQSRALFLSLAETDPTEWDPNIPPQAHSRLAKQVAVLATRDSSARNTIMALCRQVTSVKHRDLLASVIEEIGTEECVLVALDLISDEIEPPVPYHLIRAIEHLLVEQRPHHSHPNAYALVGRSGTRIRERLFQIAVDDKNRRQSALKLLAMVERWRLEYGKPVGEPRHPAVKYGLPWPPLDLMVQSS